ERQAAAMLRECRAALATRGSTVVREASGGTPEDIVDWRHYPEGEVFDPKTHAQYFYHRHPAASPAAGRTEHGHFHLFLRGEAVPAGVTPLLLPELAVADPRVQGRQSAPLKRGGRDEVCHLVAIAIDERGE